MPYIDVDLSDFDTDELVEELELRGQEAPLADIEQLRAIFTAMQLNKQEEAWNLMRTYVCDKTGRVL